MDVPNCPFCNDSMTYQEVPAYKGLFWIFLCATCHTQVKQPLGVRPERRSTLAEKHPDCPECAFGEVHCCACDDCLCSNHVRTIDKYAPYLSPNLGQQLQDRMGGQIYCPLCFQAALNRFSTGRNSQSMQKPHLFNIPIIVGLFTLLLIILIGLKRCPNAASVLQPVEIHEPDT